MEEIFQGDKLDTSTWRGILYYHFLEICLMIFVFLKYFGFIPFFLLGLYYAKQVYPYYGCYLLWMYLDRNTSDTTGGRWDFMRKLDIWKVRRDYFDLKLVKTCDLDESKSYLAVGFPHGYFVYGGVTSLMTDAVDVKKAYPGFEIYGATMIFTNLPVTKEIQRACGYVSVSERGLLNVLEHPGRICGIIPGGLSEMNKCEPGTYRIVLKNRKGFVRAALKSGSCLVPCFTFNETSTAKSFIWGEKWRIPLYDYIRKKFKISVLALRFPLPKGRSLFSPNKPGMFPHAVPLVTVVGQPINVLKVINPSQELIDEYHEKFVETLKNLFNTYKGKYDLMGENAFLSIE